MLINQQILKLEQELKKIVDLKGETIQTQLIRKDIARLKRIACI